MRAGPRCRLRRPARDNPPACARRRISCRSGQIAEHPGRARRVVSCDCFRIVLLGSARMLAAQAPRGCASARSPCRRRRAAGSSCADAAAAGPREMHRAAPARRRCAAAHPRVARAASPGRARAAATPCATASGTGTKCTRRFFGSERTSASIFSSSRPGTSHSKGSSGSWFNTCSGTSADTPSSSWPGSKR